MNKIWFHIVLMVSASKTSKIIIIMHPKNTSPSMQQFTDRSEIDWCLIFQIDSHFPDARIFSSAPNRKPLAYLCVFFLLKHTLLSSTPSCFDLFLSFRLELTAYSNIKIPFRKLKTHTGINADVLIIKYVGEKLAHVSEQSVITEN